ncbi:MAG TPA: hypothetical protein PKI17_02590 [Syntrophomonas sp.]|nr:hypothetical protein [Syntrophomonas sp.]
MGLSTGLCTELNIFGKILIVLCMFLGRVGPLLWVSLWLTRKSNRKYILPKAK